MSTHAEPKASDSGASATETFMRQQRSSTVSTDRVSAIASDALAALHEVIRKHEVTYDEYDGLKGWLIQVGKDGEWPLWLDVFIEHVIEEVNTAHRHGSKGTILGPYYVPGAPELPATATLPMRDDEPGTPLVWRGQVKSLNGEGLADSVVDLWQNDDDGYYSQFAGELDIPKWNLRGRIHPDDEGNFEIHTIRPQPYTIPTDGATGAMCRAAGWSPYRPAHLHVRVSAPGHETLIAQLYFSDDQYLDNDIAAAVKPELILDPDRDGDRLVVERGFELDPA